MATERQFGKASDVAALFDISEAAAYRLAREQRLPPGTYVYLNGRTVRFDIPALKRLAAGGTFKAKPEESQRRCGSLEK